jgi:hypothetical protein
MSHKQWFLIRYDKSNKPIICSKMYDSFEEAKKAWNERPSKTICETVYG